MGGRLRHVPRPTPPPPPSPRHSYRIPANHIDTGDLLGCRKVFIFTIFTFPSPQTLIPKLLKPNRHLADTYGLYIGSAEPRVLNFPAEECFSRAQSRINTLSAAAGWRFRFHFRCISSGDPFNSFELSSRTVCIMIINTFLHPKMSAVSMG